MAVLLQVWEKINPQRPDSKDKKPLKYLKSTLWVIGSTHTVGSPWIRP